MGTEADERIEEDQASELAGQMHDALAPVRPPPSVKRRLRDEILDVAQQRMAQDVRIESDSRGREWMIGAALGSVVALVGGIIVVLRNHLLDRPDGTRQGADRG
jgi:hypothetical protein